MHVCYSSIRSIFNANVQERLILNPHLYLCCLSALESSPNASKAAHLAHPSNASLTRHLTKEKWCRTGVFWIFSHPLSSGVSACSRLGFLNPPRSISPYYASCGVLANAPDIPLVIPFSISKLKDGMSERLPINFSASAAFVVFSA